MKRFFSIVASILLVVTTYSQIQLNGSGTQTDPFLINSETDFSVLRDWVNTGNSCEGQYFKLTRNLTTNVIIGKDYTFSGIFDGNNDTITCKGCLFVNIKNASITNLNVNITSGRRITGEWYAGGVVCEAENSHISNCYTFGGDFIFNTLGDAASSSGQYGISIGGIVGSAKNTTITNCGNYVNITRSTDYDCIIAGIVANSTSTNVISCFNKGNLSVTGGYKTTSKTIAQGIGGTCNRCYNTGTIIAVIGDTHSTASNGTAIARGISINGVMNSYNRGDVSSSDKSTNTYMAVASGIGGTNCTNCYNTGKVSGAFKGQIGSQIDANAPSLDGKNCYKWYNVQPYANMEDKLNTSDVVFYQDETPNINDGYPILEYQRTIKPICTITISTNDDGIVQGAGEYEYGTSVTLTAIPNEGYVFSHWSDGNTDNPRTITATENAQYTAFFLSENMGNRLVFVSHQDGSTIGLASLASYQTIEYSIDGIIWNNMTTSASITLNKGDILYIRGILSDNNTSSDHTQFTMSGSIAALGNINYLWNYQNLDEPLKAYCGMSLFKDCSVLVAAPELPATILAERCYQYMFQNCTSLVSAPELPASTLVQSCYAGMFQDCASLTSAPQLPAETLSSHCYWRMFRGCTSLATAPELPAAIIAPYCYNQMFMQTAITTAPELPATSLEDYSYYQMFYQCSKLNKITCLATNISATGCTTGWVTGVASSGTFIQNSKMQSWATGKDGIPSGWTTQSRVVVNKYRVTFIDWNGITLKTEQVEEGNSATAPTSPIRDGYTFIGWDKSFSNVTSDLTITAQYSLGKDSDFTVIFYNGNDGSEILTHPVVLKVPAAPEIDGFTFLKWAVVDGDLEDIIEIQAIYIANMPTSAPSVYTNPSNPAQKLVRNGSVYILTGDKTYTVTGQEVK